MAILRFQALQLANTRKPVKFEESGRKSDLFGSNVFNEKAMKQFLTKDAVKGIQAAIQYGVKIDRKMADYIASGMKEWARSGGVSHRARSFPPLAGAAAEQHDALFEADMNGDVLEKFGGGQLVQEGPDASSFPNGGIRNT